MAGGLQVVVAWRGEEGVGKWRAEATMVATVVTIIVQRMIQIGDDGDRRDCGDDDDDRRSLWLRR